jgi:hypothetical protein
MQACTQQLTLGVCGGVPAWGLALDIAATCLILNNSAEALCLDFSVALSEQRNAVPGGRPMKLGYPN